MLKIFLVLLSFSIYSCSGEIYDTIPKAPSDTYLDNYPDEHNVNVQGIININKGITTFSDTYKSYKVMLLHTPLEASDQKHDISHYSLATTGKNSVSQKKLDYYSNNLLKSSVSNEAEIMHSIFREKGRKLLENQVHQAKPVMRKGPQNISVGTKWNNVKVTKDLSSSTTTINTKCFAVSNYAYFFMEDTLTDIPQEKIKRFTEGFDEIYPIMQSNYGKENDIDNNGKIIILFIDITVESLYGYFNPEDKHSQSSYPDSNEADVFYVNYNKIDKEDDILATLAHEFQHMINYDIRSNKGLGSLEVWLDEGLSMHAEYLTNYHDKQSSDYLGGFLTEYNNFSLTNWVDNGVNYSYSMVYMRYLTERFGNDILKHIIHSQYGGYRAVEESTKTNFNTLFNDFSLAVLLSGKNIQKEVKYNFNTIDISSRGGLKPVKVMNAGENFSSNIRMYSINLLEINGNLDTLSLNGGNIYGHAVEK